VVELTNFACIRTLIVMRGARTVSYSSWADSLFGATERLPRAGRIRLRSTLGLEGKFTSEAYITLKAFTRRLGTTGIERQEHIGARGTRTQATRIEEDEGSSLFRTGFRSRPVLSLFLTSPARGLP
jgi:hypothetical protein